LLGSLVAGFCLLLREEQSQTERGALEIEQVPVRIFQLQPEQMERADPAFDIVEAGAARAPADEAAVSGLDWNFAQNGPDAAGFFSSPTATLVARGSVGTYEKERNSARM
jgi:hypothetical protein